MPIDTSSVVNEPNPANQPGISQSGCPVCNGSLILLRGDYRCSRCHFTLCVGCEGGYLENAGDCCATMG
jgi:hypothetical protein